MGAELRTGTFQSTLDDKGRLSIPVRLREWYGGRLVLTYGMQSSLWIMTPDIWEQVKGKLMNAGDLPEEEYFDIEYHYILSAEQVEIDKTGRITIPPAHRRYAGLNRDCLVLSAMNRLEIWDENFFYAYLKERRPKIHETVKKMGALGLFRTEGRGPETGD